MIYRLGRRAGGCGCRDARARGRREDRVAEPASLRRSPESRSRESSRSGAPGAGYPWFWSVSHVARRRAARPGPPAEDIAAFVGAPAPSTQRRARARRRARPASRALDDRCGTHSGGSTRPARRALGGRRCRRRSGRGRGSGFIATSTGGTCSCGRAAGSGARLGRAGVGDPAVDVRPRGSSSPARTASVSASSLGVDDATWLRAQGWASAQALIALGYYTLENYPPLVPKRAAGWPSCAWCWPVRIRPGSNATPAKTSTDPARRRRETSSATAARHSTAITTDDERTASTAAALP